MTDLKRIGYVKNFPPMNLADIIVIVVLTAAALALALTGVLGGDRGDRVVVSSDGTVMTYELNTDREIELETLTVVISGGSVYVRDSSCPDKVCEQMGKINRVNQSIVCLPSGVIITIEGNSDYQVDTGQEK